MNRQLMSNQKMYIKVDSGIGIKKVREGDKLKMGYYKRLWQLK